MFSSVLLWRVPICRVCASQSPSVDVFMEKKSSTDVVPLWNCLDLPMYAVQKTRALHDRSSISMFPNHNLWRENGSKTLVKSCTRATS